MFGILAALAVALIYIATVGLDLPREMPLL